jgi:hypothetical protein
MCKRQKRNATAAIFIALLWATDASAQQGRIILQGEVKDEHGAVIVGARATLAGEGGRIWQTVSDGQGRFRFAVPAAGSYVLRVAAAGFAASEQAVTLEDAARLSITLYPTLSDAVSVNDDTTGSALSADRAAGARTLTERELQALPDDPNQLAEQLQLLAASAGGAPGQAVVTVDGFLAGGKLPPKSAIREVRINPNLFSAEYDTPPFRGGRIEVTTRPGASAWHGAGFFHFNSTALNARDAFAPARAQVQTRRYGWQLGGPVVKKRAGFFLDFERREIDEAAAINAVILNEAFQPAVFTANAATPKRLLIGSARADWQLNQVHTLALRYDASANRLDNEGVGGFNLPERGFNLSQTEHSLRLSETSVVSPRALNELRIGLTLSQSSQRARSSAPVISVAGAFTAGGATPQSLSRNEHRLELADNLIVSAGKHTLKLGAQIFGKRFGDASDENPHGTFFFGGAALTTGAMAIQLSGLEQYRRTLLALPGGAPTRFTVTRGSPSVAVNQWLLAGFAQDEWQWRRKFSLSLGLRYEAQTAPGDGASVAPRLGLAYSPDKKQQWVLRARGGIFYERIGETLALERLRLDGSRQRQLILDAPAFPDPFAAGGGREPIPTVRRLDPALRPPASWQMRVELERQLPGGWRVSASHSWTRGWGQLRSRNINAPIIAPPHPDPVAAPRPFGDIGNILQFESSGRIAGRVLFIGLNQPVNKTFNLFSGYLNFDFRTDADNAFLLPQSSYDLRGEWARPSWQARHRVFVTALFNLPRQTRAAFSLNAASGTSFNITTGRDNNGDGNFNDRPGLVAADAPRAISTQFGALDPSTINGALGRNAGTNPATATLDLNLARAFAFGEQNADGERRYRMTPSLRASNLLNRVNPLGLSGVLASPFFGRANAATPARRIELGMRFNF